MARRDVKLIGSLVDYIQDIKPYHTKLREFASEMIFNDDLKASIVDDHHLQVVMKNMWSRDDAGCQALSTISEGTDADRYFKIPAAIWPHFSITDHFPIQYPLGDDPVATVDELVDSDGDGLPDYEDPWIRDRNTSHFSGDDWIPVKAIVSDWTVKLSGPITKDHGIGPNIIVNGDFSVDAQWWTAGAQTTIAVVGGALRVTNSGSVSGYAYQQFATVPGQQYFFSINLVGGTGSGTYHILDNGDINTPYVLSSTSATCSFTATGTMAQVWLNVGTATNGNYYDWDNVTLKLYSATTVYHFNYDLELQVDPTLEDAYGLGNSYQVFLNGNDVTYLTSRDSAIGQFDEDIYDDLGYDSEVRTFLISGVSGEFAPSSTDLSAFPLLPSQLDSWVSQFALASHRPQVEIYYTNTGRYSVPFHQGSRVYVDGIPQVFGSSYIVENGRDFIQFLGKRPGPKQTISVNLMTVDRLFISQTRPFDVAPQQNVNSSWSPFITSGYDETPYEDLPFDIGLPDIVTDYYTVKIDDIYPDRASPVSFMNSTTLDGKATLRITKVYPSAINGDIYLIAATGLWTFSVQQIVPYKTDLQYGTFKQPFDNGKISFIIDREWTPYYMAPDINTYTSYGLNIYEVFKFSTVDPTDHLINLDTETEHGTINDPSPDGIHKPVEFINIGKVSKAIDTSSVTRGWIGVETYDLNAGVGVVISDVYPKGPADNAGIMDGDIILSIGSTSITSSSDLLNLIDNTTPSTTINVTILRGIQTYTLAVEVADQLSGAEYYQFVLNDIPARGVYFEIRVEQTGGLNPRVHAQIDDSCVITVMEDGNTFMYNEVYDSRNPNNPDITVIDTDPIIIGDPSQYVDSGYWDIGYVE